MYAITSTNVTTNVTTSASDVKGSADTVAQAEKQVEAANARVDQAVANAKKDAGSMWTATRRRWSRKT